MTVGERVAAASNRFYLRIRHPDAFRAGAQRGTAGDLSALNGHKYCLLTTFRRSGAGVPTPVWFGLADGRVYVRSEADVGKVKRIRNNPRVTVAPCTMRGKPLGPVAEGRARILPASEAARAEAALRANYGLFRRIYEGGAEVTGLGLVYLEIAPAGGDGAE
jgi:PPOX class probable F420-dependent enzyme